MSAFNGAHSVRGGFNQSGGAYFICVSDLETRGASGAAPAATGTYINTITSSGSNSGGAWAAPTLAANSFSNVLVATTASQASPMSGLVGRGALLRDMGRTIVSAGRTFRKFAPVVGNAGTQSSFGVVGSTPSATNAGYGAFYLEVGREGQGTATPAPIARYF